MANDVYVFIMSKGGIVLKSYPSLGLAKLDLKDMAEEGRLLTAYAFKKFAFQAKPADEVVFDSDDSIFG